MDGDHDDPDGAGEDDRHSSEDPTPGERVLHALGLLRRLHLSGRLPVEPSAFDVADVARIVGMADKFEFAGEDARGIHYHFGDEVLVFMPNELMSWQLMDPFESALMRHNEDDFEFGGWD